MMRVTEKLQGKADATGERPEPVDMTLYKGDDKVEALHAVTGALTKYMLDDPWYDILSVTIDLNVEES